MIKFARPVILKIAPDKSSSRNVDERDQPYFTARALADDTRAPTAERYWLGSK